jgi:cysteine desulfuration protein SufE
MRSRRQSIPGVHRLDCLTRRLFHPHMPDLQPQTPPSIQRVLDYFRKLSREDKMQALVQYSKKLEPLPERFAALDRAPFTVPECQTRVDVFPEMRDGKLYFYADLNPRQSPTIAAFLAMLFAAVNGQPPATTLAIPPDFVRNVMESIGLGAREVGLNAMVERLKRHAREAERAAA